MSGYKYEALTSQKLHGDKPKHKGFDLEKSWIYSKLYGFLLQVRAVFANIGFYYLQKWRGKGALPLLCRRKISSKVSTSVLQWTSINSEWTISDGVDDSSAYSHLSPPLFHPICLRYLSVQISAVSLYRLIPWRKKKTRKTASQNRQIVEIFLIINNNQGLSFVFSQQRKENFNRA